MCARARVCVCDEHVMCVCVMCGVCVCDEHVMCVCMCGVCVCDAPRTIYVKPHTIDVFGNITCSG